MDLLGTKASMAALAQAFGIFLGGFREDDDADWSVTSKRCVEAIHLAMQDTSFVTSDAEAEMALTLAEVIPALADVLDGSPEGV